MDIPKMPSNQQLEGRQIPLLKNEFKINLRDEDRVLTLWRVEINVSNFSRKPLLLYQLCFFVQYTNEITALDVGKI